MKRSQWFVLSGGSFIVFLHFLWRYSLVVTDCMDYFTYIAVEPTLFSNMCLAKHVAYGPIYMIALVFAILFSVCGWIESRAEKRKK